MQPQAAFRLLALLTLACPASGYGQSGALIGFVVSRETGEPLAYSIVALPTRDLERFSTDSGVIYFGDLPPGPLAIRIRRLGYSPLDTLVTIGAGQPDTVRFELSRVAMHLGSVTVRAQPTCTNPGPPQMRSDSALAVMFTQLRMNAEQYRFLARAYPFIYALEVIASSRMKNDGEVRIDSKETQHLASTATAASKYRPGKVVTRRGRAYFFAIPTLVDFADRDFLGQHCFHYGGRLGENEEALIRIDVVAADRIKDPDVNGSIYLDPRTYQIRRTVLRLSRPIKQMKDVTDLEVTTNFREIMPSIPVIAEVYSVQTLDPLSLSAFDTAYEEQHLVGFQFLKGKPGEQPKRKP